VSRSRSSRLMMGLMNVGAGDRAASGKLLSGPGDYRVATSMPGRTARMIIANHHGRWPPAYWSGGAAIYGPELVRPGYAATVMDTYHW